MVDNGMMPQISIDEKYMHRCLQLARCGFYGSRPNPMVGAVIVAEDRIIGEGFHKKCGEGHAEVNAFASVKAVDESLLRQATIYVSLEPCAHYGKTPPCAELIIRKGVRRVVVGCVDPFAKVQGRGIQMIKEAGIEVTTGVLEQECRWLNRRFFTFHQLGRPYILLKWAKTQDGFIDDHGRPVAISTQITRMLVHKLRAEYEAIVVGRVTEEREHPQLNVRYWSGPNPQKIVLSGNNDIDNILSECKNQSLQSIMVEGGKKTLDSFIEAGLWDEIRIETGTVSVGGGTLSPQLPKTAVLNSTELIDGHVITSYRNQQGFLPIVESPIL